MSRSVHGTVSNVRGRCLPSMLIRGERVRMRHVHAKFGAGRGGVLRHCAAVRAGCKLQRSAELPQLAGGFVSELALA